MIKGIERMSKHVISEYLEQGDAATENSNMTFGPNGLLFAAGTEVVGQDNLERLRENGFEKLADLHEDGGVHIHDLGHGHITPYCAGHSLPNILQDGIQTGTVTSDPARHFRTVINHLVNYIGASSNEFAGAQAVNDLDIYLAPYVVKMSFDFQNRGLSSPKHADIADQLIYKEVKQSIQELLFHLNYTNRWGGQSPFSNITLAMTCPNDLKDQVPYIASVPLDDYLNDRLDPEGKYKNLTYSSSCIQQAQELVATTILDVFLEGDASGNGFTFPVLTINVTEEFFQHPLKDKVFELAGKFGTPSFQNFCNGVSGGEYLDPQDVRSMCCRLSIREDQIKKHVGGLFGNAEQTGSLQVCTMSLPYIAAQAVTYVEENPDDTDITSECPFYHVFGKFYHELEKAMVLIKEEQLWKRQVLNECFEKGYYQMAKANFKRGFDTFFTTIGFIGLWEAVQILTGYQESFLVERGMEVAKDIMEQMRDTIEGFTEETGKLFNMEATPAESACYKLAKKARKKYPSIPVQGDPDESPYFTNSCHIPAEYQNDLGLIFSTQEALQTIPNGGTATHFYCGEDLSPQEVETFVKTVCQTKIPFFSLTTVYSICIIHGRIPGYHEVCPYCSEKDLEWIKKNHPELVADHLKE